MGGGWVDADVRGTPFLDATHMGVRDEQIAKQPKLFTYSVEQKDPGVRNAHACRCLPALSWARARLEVLRNACTAGGTPSCPRIGTRSRV